MRERVDGSSLPTERLPVDERRRIDFKASIWAIHETDPGSVQLSRLRQRGVPVDAILEELSTPSVVNGAAVTNGTERPNGSESEASGSVD